MTGRATITSPHNAFAVTVYLLVGLGQGILQLTGRANADSLIGIIGEDGRTLWALSMIISGGLAGFAAFAAIRQANRWWAMKLEGFAVGGVALVWLLYWYALAVTSDSTQYLTTKMLASAMALGATFRVVQIVIEYRKARRITKTSV